MPPSRLHAADFEALVLPLLDRLYGAAVRMTGDRSQAEDLVQDACLRGFRHFEKYEPGTNFKAWIFRVMTNLFLNQQRDAGRRPVTTELDNIDREYNDTLDAYIARQDQHPERLALAKIEAEVVRSAVDALPDLYRLPVVLCDLEGFTYREIADMLELPIGTVMSRLFRGRKKLQLTLMAYAQSQGYIREEASS